ncbi:ABC transporter ATP-binding protein [Actinosynnema mirum]|uniref:ABC transporter related n=1 Tax=Actinosynnema mirum (strain ATCC 29888 / DSM 43827 / JCM 3225 / NBRC 14064 / NCIMB 13271 / NRRL B-12336 / IMRU 3971 / 101) TaxID=446462 RepID=C6WFG1_ACTMD|nr:ABC transporter ATP-binding protein [Actinosynnema mirum]ACU35896.1 ABC transporter related [Actinosynnema mirum DSM 43827]
MTLDARLVVSLGGFELDAALRIERGEVVALLGPNGAGKSTALRALAGLVPLAGGHVRVDGDAWDRLPVERRPVGVVFQDYLLFRHMSALENVAFGLRSRGVRKAEARATALGWLERVGLGEHAAARPGALSGGQAQRVALARALATSPGLLLLDEPMAAMDAGTRLRVRADLGEHLGGFRGRTLLVTHDPLDAMVLADRLVVLEAGRVVQEGAPEEVAARPRTDYVAALVGLNLLRGTARGDSVELDGGGVVAIGEELRGEVFVAFAPGSVGLYGERPEDGPRNAWPVRVVGLEQQGHSTRVRLDGVVPVVAEVTASVVASLRLRPGDELWAAVSAAEVVAYPA